MKKILLLGSQHGNELLGDMLHAHIKAHRKELLPFVTFVVGNIRAKKAGVRFVESDLNRSYTGERKTYEQRRAARLLHFIRQENFDLVLDLHTTTCDQPPCLIVPELKGSVLPFLQACSIKRLVHMRHEIVQATLNGSCPQAVAVEVNKDAINHELLEDLANDIKRYLKNERLGIVRTVHEVNHLLGKNELSEADVKNLRNFQKSVHGFTPILVGENSYKKDTHYLGFKAYNVYATKV
jgi:succinylglutamate desuccinylase